MGIQVNVSKKESEAGNLVMLPRGWYKVTISDVALKESKSEKNNGKPMYAMEFTVNEPAEFEGRKVFTNACLWDGALYTIIAILKGLGYEVDEGELEIPEGDDLIGGELMARITITPPRKVGDKEYDERNDIKSFATLAEQQVKVGSQSQTASAKTGTSLLPS